MQCTQEQKKKAKLSMNRLQVRFLGHVQFIVHMRLELAGPSIRGAGYGGVAPGVNHVIQMWLGAELEVRLAVTHQTRWFSGLVTAPRLIFPPPMFFSLTTHQSLALLPNVRLICV